MALIVTGYNDAGFEGYGRICLDSWRRCWPSDINFQVFVESFQPTCWAKQTHVMEVQDLWDFQQRHRGNLQIAGCEQAPGKSWKSKDVKRGYSFRYDALKFSKMACYTRHAAHSLGKGIMAWIDGDVEAVQGVPAGFIDDLLPLTADCAYLGRRGYHSDTGFVAFRLPQAMPLIDAWANFYSTDSFLNMMEWHSAWLFDRAREQTKVRCIDIAAPDRARYWADSPVGPYLVHHKGQRRKAALSEAKDD